ncbi:MAG: hypothetical protein UT09_C0019G0007 [Parcubacteria group bacterium GW2011_GWF2_38_8]|nr:MAG: hypothetical protein UT09_C0019G0007 [Parcubacteria group bacterium GW2011_GWF2_38_8]
MATLSNNDIARAIYLTSKNKTGLELSEMFGRIIKFLVRRRLLSRVPDILEKLRKIINLEDKRIEVKILSSRKLKEKTKNDVVSILKKRYKAKEVIIEEVADEKLLGGMRIEVNDEIIDLTIKRKIKKLQEYLIKKYEW